MGFKIGEEEFEDIRVGDEYLHAVKVGEEDVWRRSGIFSADEGGALAFRENGVVLPSTFTRASQAWDGSQLVPPNTTRVFGRDTKSPVVLIEGQRTNLIAGSNAMSGLTYWTASGSAPTSKVENAGIAPDGTLTATLFTVNNIGLAGYLYTVLEVTPETTYTFSYYAKQLSGSGLHNSVYNLTEGSWIIPNTEYVFSGDGWERVTLTFTTPAGCTSIRVYPIRWNSTAVFSVLLWGAQVEEAPFASSYIPTDGAPATRASEVQFISGLSIPKRGVTVSFAWHALHTLSTLKEAFHLRDESSSDYVALRTSSTGGSERIETAVDGIVLSAASVISDWAAHTVVIEDDGRVTRYVDGELIGTTAPVEWLEGNWSRLSLARSQSFFNVWVPIAPGAAALGIPFIDNRAWSAAEIQAAHARWLPELEKIEVPV